MRSPVIRQLPDHLLGDQNVITVILMRKNLGKEIVTITLIYPRSMGVPTLVVKYLQSILKRRKHKEALLQNGVIHVKRILQEVFKEQSTLSLKKDTEVTPVTPQICQLGMVQGHQEIDILSLKPVDLDTGGVTLVLVPQGLQNSDIQYLHDGDVLETERALCLQNTKTLNTEVVHMIGQGHHTTDV